MVSFSDQPPCLVCSGDEDRTTQSLRRTAMSRALRADRDLTVDLSDLVWADASLMLDLAMVARRLRHEGWAMILRGAQPHVQRLIELVGLDRLPGVRVEIAAA